jgi:hypothetical protein
MMDTRCRVWKLYQARCLLCDWSGEVTGDGPLAARDAREHRGSEEHKRNLAERGRE